MVQSSIWVAPMAGGPSTPALVRAAAEAGSLGFLAGGYKTPDAMSGEVAELRASGASFGLNLFVPADEPPDVEALRRYRASLAGEAERYGVALPELRLDDDDAFAAKVEIAVGAAPTRVSLTFGLPGGDVVRRLQAAGSLVVATVTSLAEARAAQQLGVDELIVQGGDAGGHSATMSPVGYQGRRPARELVAEVVAATPLPVIGAGGVGTAADVAALLDAGARAVQVGTAFLLADEAGTRPLHREALLAGDRDTVVTRAFTGHPARALRNRFTDEHPDAPLGYPAIHHLTSGLRAAAAAQGDVEGMHLWAGARYAEVRPGSTAEILARLDPR